MTKVKISPKFQIVIPRDIRTGMSLMVGESLAVERVGDELRLHRVKPLKDWVGRFTGHANGFKRDKTDRL